MKQRLDVARDCWTVRTRRAASALGLVLTCLLPGCGAEADGYEVADSAGTSSDELQYGVPGGGDVFARESLIAPTGAGVPNISASLDPALCGNKQYTYMVATRDAQRRYRVLSHMEHRGSAWRIQDDDVNNPRLFQTRPACAMIEDSSNGSARYVLVGKSDDNKLYHSTGTLPKISPTTPDWVPPTPTVQQDWVAINNQIYPGVSGVDAVAADPVMAANTTGIALAWISGTTVWAHWHGLPYGSNNWQARVSAPALPNGYVPVGTPAIAWIDGWAQSFHVIVRGTKNGTSRFFETYFGYTASGVHKFCGVLCGSQAPSWTQLPITTTISSSPTLEHSPVHGTTLYWRNGNNLYQTSGYATQQQLGTLPVNQVHPGNSVNFTGSPSALGGVRQEFGTHLILSRTTTNTLVIDESFIDENVIP